MKNKVVVSFAIVLLASTLFNITLNIAPVSVLGDPSPPAKEIWKIVSITNTMPFNTLVDINVTVSSRDGVNIACSPNITAYFENPSGYGSWSDWLFGTSTLPYHLGQMNWHVTNGSLTPISYDDIQHWGEMYFDSGGGVSYTTFMGNSYMADWNLTNPYNDPDIISQSPWVVNTTKIIDDLLIDASATLNIVFKIVITKPGAYTFNVTTTTGVSANPTNWTVGGVATVLVPYDYPTIQGAVNAASAGDTVVVSAGTYSESQIVIDKPIKVMGAGANSTIIDGGSSTSLPIYGLVRITANSGNVTFSGFALRNAGTSPSHLGNSGMPTRVGIYAESNVTGFFYTITNNVIYGTNDIDDEEDYGLYSHSGKESLVFKYNQITQTGSNAILLEKHTGSTDVSYNTLDEGVYGSTVYFSMTYDNVNITSMQTVSYNTINMSTGSNMDASYLSGAITVNSATHYGTGNGTYTNLRIIGNTILNLTNNRRGISLVNDATGNGTGGDINSPIIRSNSIIGIEGATNRRGIQLIGLITNANVSNNQVTNVNMSFLGNVSKYGGTHYPIGATINLNNFANNTEGFVWEGPTALEARYNWWGNETGPYNATSNPNGKGDIVGGSGTVLFEPWLLRSYPPLSPICVVKVDPSSVALETPSLGTQFTVNVTIANVTTLYGYQFNLTWDNTLLNLTSIVLRVPTAWGSNYISQSTPLSQAVANFSLFVSARSPAPAFSGTIAVVSLTFKSAFDPTYPNNAGCSFALRNVTVADPDAKPILKLVYNGTYSVNSVMPKIQFTPAEYTAKKVPTEFDANISVTNVANLNAFNFSFTYNTTYLEIAYPYVSVPSFSGSITVYKGWGDGTVYVNVSGLVPIKGSALLAWVHFKVKQGSVWNTTVPLINTTLAFNYSWLNGTGGQITHEAVNGTYLYRPVPGDLDMDGDCDLVDLVNAAKVFGMKQGDSEWNLYAFIDLNCDNEINILDIILVARNYGRTDP